MFIIDQKLLKYITINLMKFYFGMCLSKKVKRDVSFFSVTLHVMNSHRLVRKHCGVTLLNTFFARIHYLGGFTFTKSVKNERINNKYRGNTQIKIVRFRTSNSDWLPFCERAVKCRVYLKN